jgi:hypothetical protein
MGVVSGFDALVDKVRSFSVFRRGKVGVFVKLLEALLCYSGLP